MRNPSMCGLAAAIIALAAVATTSAQVVVPAMPAASADSRIVIELPVAEQEHVMQEMRQFLVTIASVMEASLRDDFTGVAAAARTSGRGAPTGMEKSIAPKLPPAFRQLAFETHARFDQIAVEAAEGDRNKILKRVSELLGNCVACHSGYSIRTK